MAEESNDAVTGLGIGLGLALFGLLCADALPSYVGAEGLWRSGWHVFGLLAGLVGVGGAFMELRKLLGVEGLDDIGAVLALVGIGGVLHVVQSSGAGWWSILLRYVVGTIALVAVVGLGIGVAKVVTALSDREREGPTPKGPATLSFLTGGVGLATAILNLMRTV